MKSLEKKLPFRGQRAIIIALIIALLTLLVKQNLFGQELQHESKKEIGLKELLQLGEQNYPSIAAAQLNSEYAKLSEEATRLNYLPKLNLEEQASHATANGLTGSYLTGFSYSTSGSVNAARSGIAYDGSISNLALDWSLITFGKIKAANQLAHEKTMKSEVDFQNELFIHKIKIIETYLNLIGAIKKEQVANEFYLRTITLRQSAISLVTNGIKPGVDSSIANANYSIAKRNLIEIKKHKRLFINQLELLIGGKNSISTIDTNKYGSSLPEINLTDSINFSNNPGLLNAVSNSKLSWAQAKIVEKSYLPTVHFVGVASERGSGIGAGPLQTANPNFGDGFTPNTFNYLVGLSLNWNLLFFPQFNKEVKAARSLGKSFDMRMEESLMETSTSIRNAKIEIKAAMDQALEAPIGMKAAEDAFNQTKARYDNGLATVVDLSQSNYLLNEAALDVVTSKINVWKAVLIEAAVAGNINLFLNL